MMQRSTEQYPSLQFYKSNLERALGKLVWLWAVPALGRRRLFQTRDVSSLRFCAHKTEITERKTEKWEVAENGWKGESGLLSPAQFWSHCFQNLLEDKLSRLTGCCTVFPGEHTAVCMVHIFLSDDSTTEKDQEINRLSDHKSMLL